MHKVTKYLFFTSAITLGVYITSSFSIADAFSLLPVPDESLNKDSGKKNVQVLDPLEKSLIEEKPQQENSHEVSDVPDQKPNTEPTEPESIETITSGLIFVNKQNPLSADFVPKDLIVPDVPFSFEGYHPKKQLERTAALALEKLFADAQENEIELNAVSGYRSYARQKVIFENNKKLKGEKEANRTSAYPGQSEHQTGLAMDVSSPSVNNVLEESFGTTEEGKWLAANAAKHGFIIRYPKEKEDITGYKYEPWHLRYVGIEIAEYVTVNDWTLEEYYENIK